MADPDRRPRLNMPSLALFNMALAGQTAPWEDRPALPPSLAVLCSKRVVGAFLQKADAVCPRCPSAPGPGLDIKYRPGLE